MIEFRLKADISFMADGIDDALLRLAEHFRREGTGEDSALVQSGRVLVGRLADARFAAIEAEAVAAERARYQPILDNAIARHGDPHAYRADLCRCGTTNCPVRAAVLRIIEGETLSD